MYLETDKRLAEFTLKIPEITKHKLSQLTKVEKAKLNDEILITMARVIHDSEFDPGKHLRTSND